MADPCCKGVLLVSAVAPVRAAIRSGALRREAVEARLEAEDIRFLDEKVDATAWYPVAMLGRYIELTADLMGGPHDSTYEKLGMIALETTRAAGTYQQLAFEDGRLRGCTPSDLKLFSRLLATIWGSFYNFSSWRLEMDSAPGAGEKRVIVHWEQVGPLPASLAPSTRGFIRALFEHACLSEVEITGGRVSPEHFRFVIGVPDAPEGGAVV